MSETHDESSVPLPIQVADLADILRECVEAIEAQIKTYVLYEDSHRDALRVISHNAGRAAELAVKIIQLANDNPDAWQAHIISESMWEEAVEDGVEDEPEAPEPKAPGWDIE